MKQTITVKVRIFPSVEQEELLKRTARLYTQACNFVSERVFEGNSLVARKIHDGVYRDVRVGFGLGSQMSCSVIRTVVGTYRTIHARQPKWSIQPKFARHRFNAVYGRDYTLTKSGQISLGTVGGRIKLGYANNPKVSLLDGRLGTATVRCRHGKWIMYISIEVAVPEPSQPENVVGVDRGIRHIAVTHNSAGKTRFYSGAEVKNKRAHYKQLRASLQRKQTRSARKRLKAIGDRENRWISDVNHCIAKALITSEDRPTLFVLENLSGIRKALTKVKVSQRYLQVSWAYGQLCDFMKYKATQAGHTVIEVNPAYTSQTCPKCGHVSKDSRNRKLHLFECKNCHYRSNDDRVAAMNLQHKGIQYLQQSQPNNV